METTLERKTWGEREGVTLERFNPRRHARGSEAAEMKVTWPDGDVEFLWMSKKDIKANMKEWGCSDGLLDALNAYRSNLPI